MLDLPFRSAKQLAADIRRKKIGCLELLDLYLARVEQYNPAAQRHRRHRLEARAPRAAPPTPRSARGRPGGRSTACP